MKLLKLTFVFALLFSLASCGDDEPDVQTDCTQADWVGTYTGTKDSNGASTDDATVTFTADGTTDVILAYSVTTAAGIDNFEIDPFTPDGCAININVLIDTTSSGTITGTLNNGALELVQTITSASGDVTTCTITATRN